MYFEATVSFGDVCSEFQKTSLEHTLLHYISLKKKYILLRFCFDFFLLRRNKAHASSYQKHNTQT